jgi:phage-related minor tail protein
MTAEEKLKANLIKMRDGVSQAINQLEEQWLKLAEKNPLAINKEQVAEAVSQLRQFGDEYVKTFQRMQEERRTFEGGAKEFAREWAESASNYGQITKDFLTGVTGEMSNMLTEFVKTGKLGWRSLLEFVVTYMMKAQMAKMMTPFMDSFASFAGSMLQGFMGVGGSPGAGFSSDSALASYAANQPNYGGMRALGGPVMAGHSYIVGENRRAEMFIPDHNGYIAPMESMKAGSAGTTHLEMKVEVKNYGNQEVEITQGRDDRGRPVAEITVGRMAASETNRPGSAPNRAIRNQFNVTPRMVGR